MSHYKFRRYCRSSREGLEMRQSIQVLLLSIGCLLGSCRGTDGDGGGGSSSSGEKVTGVLKSSAGSQAEMASWVVAFVERDTGVSHVGVLGALGNYSIDNVKVNQPQTLVLLDPQYRLSAVLSAPGDIEGTVFQYFTTSDLSLPSVVHQGPILKFSELSGISWTNNVAGDSDGDLIPDGLETQNLQLEDSDNDGLQNELDSDLDGDGIANWFDSDDDGDNILDPFDTDANGDGILDLTQETGDLYFKSGIEFLSVQVAQQVQADSSLNAELLFTAKIEDNADIVSITIKGASVLLNDSLVANVDLETGQTSTAAWDYSLLDDGLSEDGAENDYVFARKVVLTDGANPKANQVVFFQLTHSDKKVLSFAYTFPALITGAFVGSYDSSSRVVTKSGTPFGSEENYIWSLSIYDASSIKVYSSESIPGTTDTFTIPETLLDNSQSYTGKVVASTFDRINSFPTWIIRSQSFTIQ